MLAFQSLQGGFLVCWQCAVENALHNYETKLVGLEEKGWLSHKFPNCVALSFYTSYCWNFNWKLIYISWKHVMKYAWKVKLRMSACNTGCEVLETKLLLAWLAWEGWTEDWAHLFPCHLFFLDLGKAAFLKLEGLTKRVKVNRWSTDWSDLLSPA